MSRDMSFVKRRIPTGTGKLTSGSITTKTARRNGSKRTLILMESRIFGFFTKADKQKNKRSLAAKTAELMHGFISMTKEKSNVRGSIQRAMGSPTFGNSIRTISSSETKRIPREMAV